MKKLLIKSISILMALILVVAQTKNLSARIVEIGIPSIDESVFELNLDYLHSTMHELNELEIYLENHTGTSYFDIAKTEITFINQISDSSAPMGMDPETGPPLGIPSFLWGCVFGLVGIIVVYIITDNDKAQVKKALNGCIFYGVTIAAFYVVYFLLLLDESSIYYN